MAKSMSRKVEQKVVEPKNVSVEENSVKEEKVEKKVFDQSEGVMCRSITQGGLFVDGPKTGMVYRFIDYDDTCEIEYRDLVGLVHSKSAFVFHPYMIIDDDDFINEFPQLNKFYTEQYSIKDLKAILREENNNTMRNKIESLPTGAKDSLRNIAAVMIDNGQIDSLSKVKMLNDIFGTELSLDDAN